jgi:hypothetical protein
MNWQHRKAGPGSLSGKYACKFIVKEMKKLPEEQRVPIRELFFIFTADIKEVM